MRRSDFLPARRPLRGGGGGFHFRDGVAAHSGPFPPPEVGAAPRLGSGPTRRPRRPAPRPPCPLSAAACPWGAQPPPFTPHSQDPETFHPLGPGPGCTAGPAPSPGPSLRTPGWAAPSPTAARPHPDAHTHLRAAPRPPAPAAWTRSRGAAPFPVLRPHLIARCLASRPAPLSSSAPR